MNQKKLETLRQSIATYLRDASTYNKLFRLDGLTDGLTGLQTLLAGIMAGEPLTLDRNRRREVVEEGAEVLTREMETSLRRGYSGWKGGDFYMGPETFVWISEVGVSGGLMVKDLRVSDGGSEIWLVGRIDKEY